MTSKPPPLSRAEGRFEVSREQLFEEVWETPILHLAEKYAVSGSYLARVCTVLRVPRPPVGYWQKKAVGRAPRRPELPEAQPGDQQIWSKDRPLARPAREERGEEQPTTGRGAARPAVNALLRGTKSQFLKTRKIDANEFLRPYKQLLPDIVTSAASLERALDLANALYLTFGKKGYPVRFAPPDQKLQRAKIEERETVRHDRKYGQYGHGTIWSPLRPTIAYLGAIPIGLVLTEMSERATMRYQNGKYVRESTLDRRQGRSILPSHSWTTEQDLPCGRFRLVAYSPHPGVEWQLSWQETSKRSLDRVFGEVIRKLDGSVEELKALMDAADDEAARKKREQELQWERWRREEDKRSEAKARSESLQQLSDIMADWTKALSVEMFFVEAEKRMQMADGERRVHLESRLRLARSMLGDLDPLSFIEQWVSPEERYQRKFKDE